MQVFRTLQEKKTLTSRNIMQNCMRIIHVTYSLIIFIFSNLFALGQDNTFLDLKQEYFSKNGDSVRFNNTHKLKAYPKVNYSREIIRLTESEFKIEYCYYYDNKRFANQNTTYYNFAADSILTISGEKWIYKKRTDSLIFVYKNHSDYIEQGAVTSLVPFIRHGEFVALDNDKEVLFIEDYQKGNFLSIKCPQVDFHDSVYYRVDKNPIFPEKYGDLTKYIKQRLEYPIIARESSIAGTVYVRFVVTKVGQVKNIEIIRGVDPIMDREAFKVIAILPDFEPGKINGKAVNSYYVMPVRFTIY